METALQQPTTLETAQKLGLLPEEFDAICECLGRAPNFTELSVYSVMWSEHCSYKNSILWLKKLPKDGDAVLAAAGEENAGLLDIGEGLAVAFKVESHNHPSAIEPYQGAATGVGGIHRDIFSMGARPIGALNSLRFGDLSLPKTQHLLKGVVKGIGDYGNAFGVPTVAGEVFFDACYNTNPLVNAMSVGIVEHGKVVSATAGQVGNLVFIVGSSTGKDGIHGATFASEDITDKSEEKLPAVQVGDPFMEKLLLEATLEAVELGLVEGIQDMGAAGIACSTSEMSAKAEVGMDIQLDRVPLRQANMVPFEILLSESQERMLFVIRPEKADALKALMNKWDLQCEQIGTVEAHGDINYYWHGERVGQIPAEHLVLGGGAPRYERAFSTPAYRQQIEAAPNPDTLTHPTPAEALKQLISSPNLCSRAWIRRQYDSMVGAATMTGNRFTDAGVVYIHGSKRALAMTVDCNPRHVWAHPQTGTALAVAEAARNLVCTGAQPLGITNCLNFGNPYNPEVYWQFKEAILGMKAACEAFTLPVTGGNVSFYNQSSDDGPVFPTPTIGMVGLLFDATKMMGLDYKHAGDKLYMLGALPQTIGGSEYLYSILGQRYSEAPALDLDAELRLQQLMLALITQGLIHSAHDVSDGGLLINLAESMIASGLGVELTTPVGVHAQAFCFSEDGGRVVISLAQEQLKAVQGLAQQHSTPLTELGIVKGTSLTLDGESLANIEQLRQWHSQALPAALGVAL